MYLYNYEFDSAVFYYRCDCDADIRCKLGCEYECICECECDYESEMNFKAVDEISFRREIIIQSFAFVGILLVILPLKYLLFFQSYFSVCFEDINFIFSFAGLIALYLFCMCFNYSKCPILTAALKMTEGLMLFVGVGFLISNHLFNEYLTIDSLLFLKIKILDVDFLFLGFIFLYILNLVRFFKVSSVKFVDFFNGMLLKVEDISKQK